MINTAFLYVKYGVFYLRQLSIAALLHFLKNASVKNFQGIIPCDFIRSTCIFTTATGK